MQKFVDAFPRVVHLFGSVDRFEPAKWLKCLQNCGIMVKKEGCNPRHCWHFFKGCCIMEVGKERIYMNLFKSEKVMVNMKLFKAGTILQLIYCFCCLVVAICMPLYTAFYTTKFGDICFGIGAILTFVSTINPMGLVGAIINFSACFSSDLKKSKKILIWTILSPVLIVLFWMLAVCFFVYHSGGV